MTGTEYIEPMRAFIAERHLDGGGDLTPTTPLLEWSVLDSFTIIELVQYVEDRFGIEVPNVEINPSNFATLETIAVLLARLEGERGDG